MRIVCFGDSVTRGVSYVRGRLRILKDNYPVLLGETLAPLGYSIVNKGVFNDNSDGLVERVGADCLDTDADCVLIEIGGNDCNFHWDEVALHPNDDHEPIVPLGRYLANVRSLVTKLREAGKEAIFLSILPLDPVRYYERISEQHGTAIAHWIARRGGIAHWHASYDRSLRELLTAMQVPLIDVRKAFWQNSVSPADFHDLIGDDGIHPTEAGYQLMSDCIATQLPEWMKG